MGIWGHQPFDNDDALDWVYYLDQYSDLDFISATLERVCTDDLFHIYDSYTDTATIDNALAAAEVVAALQGNPHPSLPAEVNAWIQRTKPTLKSEITDLANQAVIRALQTPAFGDLWAEPNDYELWKSETEGLLSRLRKPTAERT